MNARLDGRKRLKKDYVHIIFSTDFFLKMNEQQFEVGPKTILIIQCYHVKRLFKLMRLCDENGLEFHTCLNFFRAKPKKKSKEEYFPFNMYDRDWKNRIDLVSFVGKSMTKSNRVKVMECLKSIGLSTLKQNASLEVNLLGEAGQGVLLVNSWNWWWWCVMKEFRFKNNIHICDFGGDGMIKLFALTETMPDIYQEDKKLIAKQKEGHKRFVFLWWIANQTTKSL